MMLPLALRSVRLAVHCRLPVRQPRLILRPLALPRRWNSTTATAAAATPSEPVNPSSSSPTPPEEPVDEHIQRLPPEARELLARQYPLIQEFISPSQSHLLTLTLQPYLGFSDIEQADPNDSEAPHNPFTIKNMLPIYGTTLPPGYHFAYFNGYTQESDLSSDGYIASQAPGGPWTRRMWAGGKLTYQPMPEKRNRGQDRGARRARPLDIGRRALCHETVEDIQMKGEPGSDNEMMFVYLRRKLWAEGFIVREPNKTPKLKDFEQTSEDDLRVLPDEEVPIIEQRCLVYMKEKPKDPASARRSKKPAAAEEQDPAKATAEGLTRTAARASRAAKADFHHTITPTPTLLFRYSALTFNAHKIHIDNDYTQNVEGHPKLLVHGPLTLTFLLQLLRNHILGLDKGYRLNTFEYRNITPLYVDEPIHLFGRVVPNLPRAPEPEEYDPREELPAMYDEIDSLRKQLQRLRYDEDITEEERDTTKRKLRAKLRLTRKASDKLEKFNPVEKRDVEYRTYELWAENDRGEVAVRGTAVLEDIPPKPELTPEQQWKRYQAEMARNRRMHQKQQMKEHKAMLRQKKRERKMKLREAQKERERVRRLEKEQLWRDAREAAKYNMSVEEWRQHRDEQEAAKVGLSVDEWRRQQELTKEMEGRMKTQLGEDESAFGELDEFDEDEEFDDEEEDDDDEESEESGSDESGSDEDGDEYEDEYEDYDGKNDGKWR
ncbi:hypothetical protein TWF696_006060 [Orbilia brochopaga]|uniref:Recombinase domain-containing protein n=1 Tax=Orbilia brochopaga TaxID=3140254 RepID=A0AAV9UV07_9PEZI